MPAWNNLQKFVTFVRDENDKYRIDDLGPGEYNDPDVVDKIAIKRDNAVRIFAKKHGLEQQEVADLCDFARDVLKLIDQRTKDNSRTVAGIALVVTPRGREFAITLTRLKLQTGKWHEFYTYHKNWSMVIALCALIISIYGAVR